MCQKCQSGLMINDTIDTNMKRFKIIKYMIVNNIMVKSVKSSKMSHTY